ncbi:hypothetical protein CGJ10_22815 [Vibrio parahaemolyticus]|nr:hypothetical protein CGJ10_22815 [Vibrio parahaemolyticus]
MPHWFSQSVGCESHWLKLWKGLVNRGFRSRFKFAALVFWLKTYFVAEGLHSVVVEISAET